MKWVRQWGQNTRELLKRGNGDRAARRPREWKQSIYKGVTMVHAPKVTNKSGHRSVIGITFPSFSSLFSLVDHPPDHNIRNTWSLSFRNAASISLFMASTNEQRQQLLEQMESKWYMIIVGPCERKLPRTVLPVVNYAVIVFEMNNQRKSLPLNSILFQFNYIFYLLHNIVRLWFIQFADLQKTRGEERYWNYCWIQTDTPDAKCCF